MTAIHLLVLVHGMWGNPQHLAELARIAEEIHTTSTTDGTALHILRAETIKDDSTYDGVDWGGERIAKEVPWSRAANSQVSNVHRWSRLSKNWRAREIKSFDSRLLGTVLGVSLPDIVLGEHFISSHDAKC